jgi:hypothetical protein
MDAVQSVSAINLANNLILLINNANVYNANIICN